MYAVVQLFNPGVTCPKFKVFSIPGMNIKISCIRYTQCKFEKYVETPCSAGPRVFPVTHSIVGTTAIKWQKQREQR